MSRTIKGSKIPWESYNGKRAGNERYHGYPNPKGGKYQKKLTHKIERRIDKKEFE